MRIQTNIMAMNTHRMYTKKNKNVSKSAEKLSSGFRINRAGDDAAGLAISEKMRAQVRGLNMASKNSQDAISLIQTAEGALQEVHSMLQRMNELANQAATGTNQTFDREQINAEFAQLKSEIDDVSEQTTFNDMKLLDGSLASGVSKVSVNETYSTLRKDASVYGYTPGNSYTVINHTGLANAAGKYKITEIGSGKINVAYTDLETNNVTNTEIDLNTAIQGEIGAGKAFKVDLSASGLGVYDMTATSRGTASAEDLAKSLHFHANTVYTVNKNVTNTLGTPSDISDGSDHAAFEFGFDKNAIVVSFMNAFDLPDGEYRLKFTNYMASGKPNVSFSAVSTSPAATEYLLSSYEIGNNYYTSWTLLDWGYGLVTKISGGPNTQTAERNAAVLAGAVFPGTFTVSSTPNTNSTDLKGTLLIQVGANEGEQLGVSIEKMNTVGLGLKDSRIDDQDAAGKAITATQNAINTVSEQRATLGAIQNRLEHKITNLDNTSENLSSAESRIRDVDVAKEMTTYTKNNILSQAATAMLSQANAAPQNVMSLIQG